MAFVQQEYIIGQEFLLCSQALLSVADNEWTWERRTLSGFITEAGDFIEPASLTSFDVQEANVCGIWTMDKGRKFGLCCLGQTGGVSVTFTISSIEAPLADEAHPFISAVTLTSTESLDTYKWTDIVAHIEVEPGTKIKSLSAYQWYGSYTTVENMPTSTTEIYSQFWAPNRPNSNYWDNKGNPFNISIDFTNQGVLTYIPNKTYVNQ